MKLNNPVIFFRDGNAIPYLKNITLAYRNEESLQLDIQTIQRMSNGLWWSRVPLVKELLKRYEPYNELIVDEYCFIRPYRMKVFRDTIKNSLLNPEVAESDATLVKIPEIEISNTNPYADMNNTQSIPKIAGVSKSLIIRFL